MNGDEDLTLLGRVIVALSILLGLIAAGLGIDRRYVTRAEANQIQQACKDEWERIRQAISEAREERDELARRIREMDEKARDRADLQHRENQGRLNHLAASIEGLGKDLAKLYGAVDHHLTNSQGE